MHNYKKLISSIVISGVCLLAYTGVAHGINAQSNTFLEDDDSGLIQDEINLDYSSMLALDITPEEDLKKAQNFYVQGLLSYRQGRLEQANNDMAQAKQLYTRAIEADAKNILALNGLAGVAIFLKQPQVATDWVEKSLKVDPANNKTWLIKAEIALANGDAKQANKIYQQILQRDDQFILAYLAKAKLALVNNDLNAAAKYYKKIIELDKKIIIAYFSLASIEYRKNNLKSAENYLQQAFKASKGNKLAESDTIDKLVKWYLANKQGKKLLSFVKELTKIYPGNIAVQTLLVRAQLLDGDKKGAEQTLRTVISDNKNAVQHRLMLAKLLSDNNENKAEVLQLLDESVKLTPEKPSVRIIKTNYLISQQDYEQADKEIQIINRLFSSQGIVKNLEGNLFLAKKENNKAIKSYQEAYQAQNNLKLLYKIVKLMEDEGQISEATVMLEKVLVKQPKNLVLHYKIALLYQKDKNNKSAISHYQKILAVKPGNVLALNNLAWLYSVEGNPAALQTAKKAYDLAPTAATVADTYGHILTQQGEAKKATSVLEKAVKSAPEAKDIHYHLAEAYSQTGKRGQAQKILSRILQDSKPFTEEKNARALQKKLAH